MFKTIEYDDIKKDYYEINEFGCIRIIKSKKYIKPFVDKYGYLEYGLSLYNTCRKNFKSHILCFITFGNSDDVDLYINYKHTRKIVINHKDSNKQNNHISNLEVCTQSYNVIHAIAHNKKKVGFDVSTYNWLTIDILKDMCNMINNREPTYNIIQNLNLHQYEESKNRLKRLINGIACGYLLKEELRRNNIQLNIIEKPRPCKYTDDDIHFICKKLDEGLRNKDIVDLLYIRFNSDRNDITIYRRYKALVTYIRHRVHRCDISDLYNFWR